jgi:hypothetical protein
MGNRHRRKQRRRAKLLKARELRKTTTQSIPDGTSFCCEVCRVSLDDESDADDAQA